MVYASSDLIEEHEAILFSLTILEKICGLLDEGKDVPVKDLTEMVEFLKLFADKCHHGKEEGFFFPALERVGVPRANGPIGVMLAEHEMGRNFIKGMSNALENKELKKDDFIRSSRGYIALLRSHIEKESTVLFPMGDTKLSKDEQKELLIAFEDFEDNVIGKGKHEELHEMLHDFEKRYLES